MSGRLAALGVLATLALAGTGWLLLQTDAALPASAAALVAGPGAGDRPAPDFVGPPAPPELPAAVVDAAPAPVVPLAVADGLSAGERVDELFDQLEVLADRRSFDERERLTVLLLERFELDTQAAGQRQDAAAALRARLDVALAPVDAPPLLPLLEPEGATRDGADFSAAHEDGRRAWIAARGLVALVGLGEAQDALARCAGLPASERPSVLLALAWDPLREGDGLALPVARADRLVRGPPLLPLPLGRVPSEELAAALAAPLLGARGGDPPWLREVDGAPLGPERAWLLDTLQLVLGSGADRSAVCLAVLQELVDRRPEEAGPALFALVLARSEPAREALAALRRPHARRRLDEGNSCEQAEALLLDLARIQREACADELRPPGRLAAELADADVPPSARLAAVGEIMAWLAGDGCAAAARATLSDALVSTLEREADPDVIWTALLALSQLHTQEALLPRLSIGYGSEPDGTHLVAGAARAARRSAVLLARLTDDHAPHRRLAALSLFSVPGEGRRIDEPTRAALQQALDKEQDPEVASWLRLALRLG